MKIIGWILIGGGVLLQTVGIGFLVLGAIQFYRQIFRTAAAAPAAPGVDLGDLTKLIEAIIKMPQWLLMLLSGDVQVWFGYWLVTGSRLF